MSRRSSTDGSWALAVACLSLVCSAILEREAGAWTVDGHAMVARSAVELLPAAVPEFFRRGGEEVAHGSIDPDLFKLRDAPALRDGESPEHYLDLEYLRGAEPPPERYEYLRLLARKSLDPARVGLLAHAVTEEVERLAVAFAEYRRFPDDRMVRAKTLYFAGHLAHYASDLCQPLHTTVHFDGRVPEGGQGPRSGIHRRVDSLFVRVGVEPDRALLGATLELRRPVFPAVLEELLASHRLVDGVYELERFLEWAEGETAPRPVASFSRERYRAATTFVASLFLTAWELSEDIDIPRWVDAERRRGGSGIEPDRPQPPR